MSIKEKLYYGLPNLTARYLAFRHRQTEKQKRRNRLKSLTSEELASRRFLALYGNETFRTLYKLNQKSIVFDLGGYVGDWTQSIYELYGCECYIFEPVLQYYSIIQSRFSSIDKIHSFHLGLANETRDEKIMLQGVASTVFPSHKPSAVRLEKISLVGIQNFLEMNNLSHIDLMKINIEGSEYDLLESMLDTDLIKLVDNLQLQFHNIPEIDAERRMKVIWERLDKTHKLTWKFRPFVWENWKIRT